MREEPLDHVELAALVYSLRQLADTFLVRLPGAEPLPPVSNPFDERAEVQNVNDLLKALCRDATDQQIAAMRDRAAPASPGETSYQRRLRKTEVRFYTNILVARGVMKKPLFRSKGETTEVYAKALRMVAASFLLNVPDDQIIAANRETFAQHQAFTYAEGDENGEAIQLSMLMFMDFLGKFMDNTGITDRFMASLPPQGGVH